MNDDKMNAILRELGKKSLPSLPADFRRNVWREIEHRESEVPAGWKAWLEEFLSTILSPQPVAASLAIALAVGVAAAWTPVHLDGAGKASNALALGVFSPRNSGLVLEMGRK